MKHNKKIQNTTLFFLITISFFLRSDTIPSNSHAFERTVVITNCNDFQNVQFIGFIEDMMSNSSFYIIEENKQLTKGYKFNNLHVVSIKKATLESIGGIENLTGEYIYNNTRCLPNILSSGTYYINNSSSLIKDELLYEIVEGSDDTYKIELRRRILTFDDDQKTINF